MEQTFWHAVDTVVGSRTVRLWRRWFAEQRNARCQRIGTEQHHAGQRPRSAACHRHHLRNRRGFFADEGLEVNLELFASGGDLTAAIASGDVRWAA